MVNIITGKSEQVKKTNIKHSVDDKTVIIGKNTGSVDKKQTQRMLEQQLDTLPKGETREVYDKVWKGVKQFT